MRRLLRRAAPVSAAIPRTARMLAVGGAVIMLVVGTTAMVPPPPAPQPSASPSRTAHTASATPGNSYQRIFLPDLLVIEPDGLGAKQLKKLAKIGGVGNLIAADGAAIKIRRHRVNVLGVDPQQFRSWTPLATASDQRLWTALGRGHFVASTALAKRLKLHPGSRYRMTGGGQQDLIFGGSAPLGVSGVGALVSNKATPRLGLIPGVLALISAPGASMGRLTKAVRGITGHQATIISLRQEQQQQLPVDRTTSGTRPGSYPELFKESAARYCPGLSWTVLAAIGQIESGDGSNTGPSSAGALGPMQFLPSTWQVYGISAFGNTGPPDIMDPFDAVPSAARLLCANGGSTAAGLRGAIFAYNHATWYVNEVLALAQQYARDYG
jgi:Transglycosylase SLT domain